MDRRSFLKHTGITMAGLGAGRCTLVRAIAAAEQPADLLALYEGRRHPRVPPYHPDDRNGWRAEYWGCEDVDRVTMGSPMLLTSPVFRIEAARLLFTWPGEHIGTYAALEIDGKAVCLGLIDETWRCWDVSAQVGRDAVLRIYDVKRHKPETKQQVMAFMVPDTAVDIPPVRQFENPEKKTALLPTNLTFDPVSDQHRDQERVSDYSEKYRPQYHFTRNHGWMNDPNGLIYYQGEYHLCMQAHNFWGHAISTDLVHWKQVDDAFGTDNLGNAWSGSAVIDWNNTSGFQQGDEPPMVAIYTSCGSPRINPDEEFPRQQMQSLAYSNDRGRTWAKYGSNPVLRHHHRDPKVFWHAPIGRWVMALMLRLYGTAFFSSPDLKHWRKESVCTAWEGECPDFFPLTVEGEPGLTKWIGVNGHGRYWIGDFDGKTYTPETEMLRVEYGRHHYSTQTFNNMPEGRVVQVAWFNAHGQWGTSKNQPEGLPDSGQYPGNPFNQQMNFPREWKLRRTPLGLRVFSNPVHEIENIHGKAHEWKDLSLRPGANPLKGLKHDLYDLTAVIKPGEASEVGFTVAGERIRFTPSDRKVACGAHTSEVPFDGTLKLRLLIDRISIEIIVNDGEQTMTYAFLPREDAVPLAIYAQGGEALIAGLKVVELKSIWGQSNQETRR